MSDHKERACTKCGSLLHHEDDCPKQRMSHEAQRIAIAEACGWKKVKEWGCGLVYENPSKPSYYRFAGDLPDYIGDLNAMHEAEKVLVARDLWWKFCAHLNAIVCEDADEPLNQDPETLWGMVHATAAQRAEAFLRTIGKWEDSK